MDARRWPVRDERLQLYTHYCKSSKSLEGDRGMDTVQPFNSISSKVHTRNSFFKKKIYFLNKYLY